MKLSVEHLRERHAYWMKCIAETGIWDENLFQPVEIVIRKNHRRYNAVFQRRIKTMSGKKEITDKIVFYNKVEEFDSNFIDSVLVHEMIHQYIIQNGIKDTSPHGKIFKSFMVSINRAFPEDLIIRIKDTNPALPLEGEGEEVHNILILHLADGSFLCCVINPKKKEYFENQTKRNKKRWGIMKWEWAESNDVFFNRFSRCTTRLHGIRKSGAEMGVFRRQYNLTTVESPSNTYKSRWTSLFRKNQD